MKDESEILTEAIDLLESRSWYKIHSTGSYPTDTSNLHNHTSLSASVFNADLYRIAPILIREFRDTRDEYESAAVVCQHCWANVELAAALTQQEWPKGE